jgi:ribosomal protein S18 acetylase RimI-like enzyme
MERDELLRGGDHNLAATLRLYAATAPGAAIDDTGGVLLVSTSRTWPSPYHNGCLRLDEGVDPAAVLARAEAFFAQKAHGFCVWIADHADGDLERHALGAGYASVSERGAPRMAIERPLPDPVAPAGVTFEEVRDEDGRRAYLAVTVDAYADSFLPADAAAAQLATLEAVTGPQVRAVVAYDGGRPVSAAMSVASGRVAGVQLVGTVPGARGRGLAEQCTRWAVAAGFASGAQAVVLEASEAGEPLYLRMGFTVVSRYRWCLGPAPPARA